MSLTDRHIFSIHYGPNHLLLYTEYQTIYHNHNLSSTRFCLVDSLSNYTMELCRIAICSIVCFISLSTHAISFNNTNLVQFSRFNQLEIHFALDDQGWAMIKLDRNGKIVMTTNLLTLWRHRSARRNRENFLHKDHCATSWSTGTFAAWW